MMNLLFDPSKQQRPRRILLYGVEKIGKTTWARSAPNPIEIPTEDAFCIRPSTSLPISKTLEQFCSYLKWVRTTPSEYKTLIIDTLDWLEPLIHDAVCSSNGATSIGLACGGYGNGYRAAADIWRKLLDGLTGVNLGFRGEDQPKGPGMQIILLAHSRVAKHTEPGGESYDRYVTPLHKDADFMVREWCDDILFCTYKQYYSEKDVGFNKKVTKAIGTGERVIYTTARPGWLAGNRLDLPHELPMNYESYAEHINPKKDAF